MPCVQEVAFDKLAGDYDLLWSSTPPGIAQRLAVWRYCDSLFKPGDAVLDLGCGTGIDALHLQTSGVSVYGIDSSPQMVDIAKRRGISAQCFPIEHLQHLGMQFDGAISNFGALNCVASLSSAASALSDVIRPGGRIALCFIGRVCFWELAYYLYRKNPRKALRRLGGQAESSFGVRVFYPRKTKVISAFQRYFRLLKACGIGLFVPPSYVQSLSENRVKHLSEIDAKLARYPVFRSLADHRLYIFERI